MHISPGSPCATRSPVAGSFRAISVFSSGNPMDPSFFFPFLGFMVVRGEVSVMPYTSSSLPFPMMLSRIFWDSSGKGDAADMQV